MCWWILSHVFFFSGHDAGRKQAQTSKLISGTSSAFTSAASQGRICHIRIHPHSPISTSIKQEIQRRKTKRYDCHASLAISPGEKLCWWKMEFHEFERWSVVTLGIEPKVLQWPSACEISEDLWFKFYAQTPLSLTCCWSCTKKLMACTKTRLLS